jgi:hypothetical protein
MKEAHPSYHIKENVLNQLAVHFEKEIVQAVVQAAQYAEKELGQALHRISKGNTIVTRSYRIVLTRIIIEQARMRMSKRTRRAAHLSGLRVIL